ncbi:hypothetical protein Aave_3748 [Paracidovorax citrulli AAC00-1]|uniref:Uncharacterized protein n=1 Tax=Paracidovorax citrulli (strain AAC00-1) TaxID=397945 RepID=A1TTK7_PARC0|nr:hypothetical protein Aave_3748 [Paracidovorax citrulli AAC00-1]
MIRKLMAVAATFFAAGYFAWVIFASSTIKEFCTTAGDRCVTVHGWWVDSPIMRGERSIVIYKRGIFSSAVEIMTVDFFDEDMPILSTLADSVEGGKRFGWGEVYDLNLNSEAMRKIQVASVFSGSVYVPSQRALVNCADFKCLNEIRRIHNSK